MNLPGERWRDDFPPDPLAAPVDPLILLTRAIDQADTSHGQHPFLFDTLSLVDAKRMAAALVTERLAHAEPWQELGRLLKSGGMADPYFLIGMVQSCVRIANERREEVERLQSERLAHQAEIHQLIDEREQAIEILQSDIPQVGLIEACHELLGGYLAERDRALGAEAEIQRLTQEHVSLLRQFIEAERDAAGFLVKLDAAEARASRLSGALDALVAQWRVKAAQVDTVHATMGCGWHACADDLAAAFHPSPGAPDTEPHE